jgi:peptidoglycan LD-endopeptidase CwlK
MRDKISIQRLQLLHPKVRSIFQGFIEDAENGLNLTIRITQGLRTFAEQEEIYEQGRSKPGKIVTWSPPGTSYHNYGLAIDVVPYDEDGVFLNWNFDYTKLYDYSNKYKLTWGGNFPSGKKDIDHYENTFGINWRELLHKYNTKDFIAGTTYVNI